MIKQIHIENYKGIRVADIKDFGMINIIVGKNNCCKTSLLEALFLNDQFKDALKQKDKNENSSFLYFLCRIIDLEILEGVSNILGYDHKDNEYLKLLSSIVYNHNLNNIIKVWDDGITYSINDFKKRLNKDREKYDFVEFLKMTRERYAINPTKTRRGIADINNFLPITINSNQDLLELCSELKISNKEEHLLKTLQKIDDRILDIQPLPNSIYLRYKGLNNLVPINSMGDGVLRVLEIITKMYYSQQNKTFFIDEIENGLHYKTQKTLIRALLQSSKDYEMQVFVTTHSYEMIKHFRDVLEENEYTAMQKDIKVVSLLKLEDGELKGYSANYNSINNIIDTESEIR